MKPVEGLPLPAAGAGAALVPRCGRGGGERLPPGVRLRGGAVEVLREHEAVDAGVRGLLLRDEPRLDRLAAGEPLPDRPVLIVELRAVADLEDLHVVQRDPDDLTTRRVVVREQSLALVVDVLEAGVEVALV